MITLIIILGICWLVLSYGWLIYKQLLDSQALPKRGTEDFWFVWLMPVWLWFLALGFVFGCLGAAVCLLIVVIVQSFKPDRNASPSS